MEQRYNTQFLRVIQSLGDILLLYIAFFIIQQIGFINDLSEREAMSFFFVFAFSWVSIGLIIGTYDFSRYSLMRSIGINLAGSLIIHFLLILTLLEIFSIHSITMRPLLILYFFVGVFLAASRVLYKLIRKYLEFSGFDLRRVVIVGTTQSGKSLHQFFSSHRESGYVFKGFFDNYPNPDIISRKLIKGTIDDLAAYCERESIDEIYFALPLIHKELIERLEKFADDNCIYFRIAPEFSEVIQKAHNVYVYDSIPVVTTRKEPLSNGLNASFKRVFDILFSLSVILFLFPFIIPLIVFAIKMDSKGPIIFKQLRPGKKNKLFECYKFRTMEVNNNTEQMAVKNDPRVTKVGAFLRKTSLDELPQFFNVLLGDMSVVGPRPNMISQLEEYSRTLKKYKVRHFVTPGITGHAQVNGYRGEIEGKESMERRVEYDVEYMENWSLLLDVKIIFKTVLKVFKGDKQAY